MAGRVAYYGGIVKDGLVLNLDAAKRDSYPRTGTTWRDISGNQNNGTLTNGPTFNSDNGGSFVFDGSDDYVQSNFIATTSIGNGNPFTMSCVFKTSLNLQQMLCGCPDTPRFYMSLFNRTGVLIVHWGIGNSNNSNTSSAILNINTIYNYTFTYSGTIVKSYLNGILVDTNTIGAQSYNSNPLRIGKYTDLAPLQLSGNTYQSLIYNRALTAQEVLQNYNATKGRYGL
jgi:hypothetical protein